MAAFAWKAWREKLEAKLSLVALTVPSLGFASNCLYVVHSSGSLMPDALWVLHGYERTGMLVSRTTLPGLQLSFPGPRRRAVRLRSPFGPRCRGFWRSGDATLLPPSWGSPS